MSREISGRHVLGGFTLAFGVIIAVNLTLAYQAVRTFPGLEVANSYVASQSFDRDRTAQEGLNWDVRASLKGNLLRLSIEHEGRPVFPTIESAIFGRATSVIADQEPAFRIEGDALIADVTAAPGNWNLRLKARAETGELFQQRIVVQVME